MTKGANTKISFPIKHKNILVSDSLTNYLAGLAMNAKRASSGMNLKNLAHLQRGLPLL